MTRNRHYIFSLLLLFCCSIINAQQKLQFSIASFQADKFDTSANIGSHVEVDGSGNKYAIIKVSSNNFEDNLAEFNFNFGNMASHVSEHDGELWVYVQHNAKNVTISRSGYIPISKHNLGMTIEAGHVYKMKLTSDHIHQQIVYDVRMQMVKFQTSPAVQGAIIMVTSQSTGQKESLGITGNNGAVSKALNFGKYTYEVMSSDNLYHPSEGVITLNNSDEVHTERVLLRPRYAEISLSVEGEAEIYINSELKGKGKWTGKLTPGTYLVNSKKTNHRDSQQRLIVEEGKAQNIQLNAPIPIKGTLTINTDPTDAAITIDGKDYGKSPKLVKDLLVGRHDVILSLNGYKNEKRQITIEESKVTNLDMQLQKGAISSVASGNDIIPFTVNGVKFNMIKVDGGTFTMGATSEMIKPDDDEKPAHQVTLSSYYIGETEVTQALWQAIMGTNPSHFKGANKPVENVSWNDCQTFIRKVNSLTGQQFRLPTEAEWEFAARGGNKSRHTQYSGGSDINAVAWYWGNSGKTTHNVKTKQPNELGIYDMAGNVWEWCQDRKGEYGKGQRTNPIGPSSGGIRIIRGGSWGFDADRCRSSVRYSSTPFNIINYLGLRLALTE